MFFSRLAMLLAIVAFVIGVLSSCLGPRSRWIFWMRPPVLATLAGHRSRQFMGAFTSS